MRLALALLSIILLGGAKAKPKKGSLQKSSFQEIIDRYLFIGDFNEKPAEREISSEPLWRYPFKMAPQVFPFDLDKTKLDAMAFRVPGDGRIVEHFAKGRVEFLEGKYDEAHTTWLAARMQSEKDLLATRRLEFFLAINAAQTLRERLKITKGDISKDSEIRRLSNRVGYFLAAAFLLRRDIADPAIDQQAPWALYNLSVIYHMLERWNLLAGSTEEGLTTLLKQGRKDYRPRFRQMLAEVHIKNSDMLSAIQELDTAIRQDPDPVEAARMFNRVGDIYYSLNNFELAEDVYTLAARVDETQMNFVPTQALLRGESIFWLGKFEASRQLMNAAVDASVARDGDWLTASQSLPWIRLRIADTWMAQRAAAKPAQRQKLADEARLAYFRVETEHPSSEAAAIARVRGACLELPTYAGNNVRHGRELLIAAKEKGDLPVNLQEMVDACLVASYSDRERTPEMVKLVKDFADRYPNSKYLDQMIPAVRVVQASNIETFFQKGQNFSATEFFEAKRKALFPKIDQVLARKLFIAYVDTSRSDRAQEFWPSYARSERSDEELLRTAAFLAEMKMDKRNELSKASNNYLSVLMQRKWLADPSKKSQEFVSRILSSARSRDHLLWVARAAEVWSKEDPEADCTVSYPLASRIYETRKDPESRKAVARHLDGVFPEKWESLAKNNPSCAQSWLDLEGKFFDPTLLKSRYKERDGWKLEGPWLERLWVFSEQLEQAGLRGDAVAIWKKLAKDAPATSFESRMAKTRLAPPDTEVESLWR